MYKNWMRKIDVKSVSASILHVHVLLFTTDLAQGFKFYELAVLHHSSHKF